MSFFVFAGNQQIFGPNGFSNQAFGASNANLQNQFGTSNSGSQTNAENFKENGIEGSKASSASYSNQVNNGGGGNGNFGTNTNSNSGVGNGLAYGNSGANTNGAFFGGKRNENTIFYYF